MKHFKAYIVCIATLSFSICQSQQLDCCASVTEVETYLSGDWKTKNGDVAKVYRHHFKEGVGTFKVYVKDALGNLELDLDSGHFPSTKVVQSSEGFEIEHDVKGLKTYMQIVHLDSTMLIVSRRDRKQRTFYRVLD